MAYARFEITIQQSELLSDMITVYRRREAERMMIWYRAHGEDASCIGITDDGRERDMILTMKPIGYYRERK